MLSSPLTIVLIGAAVIAVVLILLAVVIESNARKKNAGSLFKAQSPTKKFHQFLHAGLEEFPLTRRFINRIENRLVPLYPAYKGEKMADDYLKPVNKIVLLSALASAASLFFIFGLNASAYTLATALFIAYVLVGTISDNVIRKEEIAFLKNADTMLQSVIHYFYQQPSPKDALERAMHITEKKMRTNGDELYQVLNSPNTDEAKRTYMAGSHHKFLKLFLELSERVEEYGDTVTKEDGSVYVSSLMQIRSDMQDEKRYIQEKHHRFMALGLTAAIPVIAVPYIANWAMDTLPSLGPFYVSRIGSLIKIFLLLVSVVCYEMVEMLMDASHGAGRNRPFLVWLSGKRPFSTILRYVTEKDYSKTIRTNEKLKRTGEKYNTKVLILRKISFGVLALILSFMVIQYGHKDRREYLMNDTSEVENLSDTADGKQISAMEKLIPEYVKKFIESGEEIDREQLEYDLLYVEQGLRTEAVAHETATEIIERVDAYRNEVFDPLDIFLVIICTVLGFAYPGFMLDVRGSIVNNKMQEEVIQFQSLINMQSRVPGITSMTILESMEEFSYIFKPAIQQCINEFNIDDTAALQRLYNTETYPGFRKIVDNFLMVDEVGLELAFAEVGAEIINFKEDRKLERQMMLDDEVTLGTILAVIPGGLILFGYLLIPFMYKAMTQFNTYMGNLNAYATQ